MADSITTRISRLIAGGAHALLDRAENLAPEASMMQSIREIEQVADEVRGDLGRAEAGKHLALSQMARLNAEHETLSAQIDAALANGREDLARTAIGRQADIEDLLPVLQKKILMSSLTRQKSWRVMLLRCLLKNVNWNNCLPIIMHVWAVRLQRRMLRKPVMTDTGVRCARTARQLHLAGYWRVKPGRPG